MKLLLIFIFGLVSLSCQQLIYHGYSYPRMAFLYPRNTQSYTLQSNLIHGGENNYFSSPMDQEIFTSEQGRKNKSARKIFGGITINLPPSSPTKSVSPSITIKRTVFSSIQATLTVVQFISCIGSLQFVTAAGPRKVTSTLPCSRRRREAEIVDALVEATPVLPIETSITTEMRNKKNFELMQSSSDVESSQLVPQEQTYRRPRFLDWDALLWSNWETEVTVTTVFTSFALRTASVLKSFTLVSSLAPGPGLLCLPAGYYVC